VVNFGGRVLTTGGGTTFVVFLLEDVSGIEDDRRFLFLIMDLNGELGLVTSDMTELGPSSEPLVFSRACRRFLFMKKKLFVLMEIEKQSMFFSVITT